MKLFNTTLILVVEKYEGYEVDFEYIKELASWLQSSLNIYDKSSEISALNYYKRLKVTPYLRNILLEAKKYEVMTDYYFNTNQKFDEVNNIEILDDVVLIENEIDLGGIAKGYFMLLLKNFLDSKNVKYELDFGGSMLFSEDKIISIRDMDETLQSVLKFNLRANESMHTSSFYWQTDGKNTHIHSKEHGYEILKKSVSVIDSDPVLADALSTALYCMDIDIAIDYIKSHSLQVIYIADTNIYVTDNIENIEVLKGDYNIVKI